MTSMSSPTGLYSGGLRWVDPPGAAAVSVKPSDGAGPGPPENSWGGAAAVTGGARSAPAAAGGRRAGDGRRPAGAVGNRPGTGQGGGRQACPPVKPPPAWRREHQRRGNTAAMATAGAGWDGARRPARGEAGGTKLGGRGGAALPWVLCQSELHRRPSWCRVRTTVRFISLGQRRGAATWCTTRLAWAECTMIVRLTGKQCRYRKLPSGVSRPGAGPVGPGGSSLSNRPRSAWVFEACSE
jgi:hypothetical protein